MYGFVYLTTCKINNKKYIGMCSHEKLDKEKYLGSGKYLKNAIKRYGKDNFIREILEECATKKELAQAEASWIAKYNATDNSEFYNLLAGGYGGDPKIIKSIWDSRTIEQRKEIGNKVSKTRKKLGLAVGANNPMYGRSAITEKNLKWYTNGKENKYITEGTQLDGFVRGRTNLSGKIGRKFNEVI